MLHFLAEQRGAEPASDVELAILLDYYFMHVLALLTMRIWDDGDPDENLDRLNAMLAELQGPNGSGQQFAADAETLMLIGTSHYEPEEWGYGKLLAKVRTLDERHQFRIGLGHASSMGCHLRFGFEAQCGRDTLALRDDNIADYPWLCFALAAVMREYARLADARHRESRSLGDRRGDAEWPDRRRARVHRRAAAVVVGLGGRSRRGSSTASRGTRRRCSNRSSAIARPTRRTRRCRSSSTSPTTSSRAPSSMRCCGERRGTCR